MSVENHIIKVSFCASYISEGSQTEKILNYFCFNNVCLFSSNKKLCYVWKKMFERIWFYKYFHPHLVPKNPTWIFLMLFYFYFFIFFKAGGVMMPGPTKR